jgi:molybdenum cofactor guanylyltransferase
MHNDITGIILAGGKSSRMGQNKALMPFRGEPIIDRLAALMKSKFKRVILVTNTPDEYSYLNIECFTDFYENIGPLAGIHSGLVNSKTERNFVLSCDIPLINCEIIEYICSRITDMPITIVRADGFLQHLCGIYNRKILPYAADMLMKAGISGKPNTCNIHKLTGEQGAEIIDAFEIPGYTEGMFLNLNRPEDYERLISQLH